MTLTAQQYADLLNAKGREIAPGKRLLQDEVDLFDVIAAKFAARAPAERENAGSGLQGAAEAVTRSTGLKNAGAFFTALRQHLGSLSQQQVDGFNRLLDAMGKDGWGVAWAAYGLATPWWETNKQMTPVEEGYYLGAAAAKRHQRSLRYYPWYGRGDVQLTWERNYRAADAYLASIGLIQPGELIANPDLALRPDISAAILVWGMKLGKFTGKKLGDYLPSHGPGDLEGFKQARRIINGTDKWTEIAAIAQRIQAALQAGGWA